MNKIRFKLSGQTSENFQSYLIKRYKCNKKVKKLFEKHQNFIWIQFWSGYLKVKSDSDQIIYIFWSTKPHTTFTKSLFNHFYYYLQVEISKNTTLNSAGYSQNEIIYLDVQDENDDWSITDE